MGRSRRPLLTPVAPFVVVVGAAAANLVAAATLEAKEQQDGSVRRLDQAFETLRALGVLRSADVKDADAEGPMLQAEAAARAVSSRGGGGASHSTSGSGGGGRRSGAGALRGRARHGAAPSAALAPDGDVEPAAAADAAMAMLLRTAQVAERLSLRAADLAVHLETLDASATVTAAQRASDALAPPPLVPPPLEASMLARVKTPFRGGQAMSRERLRLAALQKQDPSAPAPAAPAADAAAEGQKDPSAPAPAPAPAADPAAEDEKACGGPDQTPCNWFNKLLTFGYSVSMLWGGVLWTFGLALILSCAGYFVATHLACVMCSLCCFLILLTLVLALKADF